MTRNPVAAPSRRAIGGILLCLWLAGAAAGELRVGGTGSSLGFMEVLAAAFEEAHPGHRLTVYRPSMGSGGGIRALRAGELELAVSARPLKEEERAAGLTATEFTRSPMVFVVGRRTPAPAGLDEAQLVEIYAGRTGRWADGSHLRLVLRPERDAATAALKAISPQMAAAVDEALKRKGMVTALTDQDSADMIERIPGTLGTAVLTQVVTEKRHLVPLPIGGVAPDAASLRDGRYPWHQSYYLIAPSGATGDAAAELELLFAFLRSDEAQRVLEQTGNQVVLP